MKHILKFLTVTLIVTAAVSLGATSCRFAPSDNPGDTVAASVFEPVDTTSAAYKAKMRAQRGSTPIVDSVGMYVIGEGSSSRQVQLLSYPSRRDTLTYPKTTHYKVSGSADYGHVVRVKFWVNKSGDSLVSRIEEVKQSKEK